jgi:hypothetical protein
MVGRVYERSLALRVEAGECGAQLLEALLLGGLEHGLGLLHVQALTGLVQLRRQSCRFVRWCALLLLLLLVVGVAITTGGGGGGGCGLGRLIQQLGPRCSLR